MYFLLKLKLSCTRYINVLISRRARWQVPLYVACSKRSDSRERRELGKRDCPSIFPRLFRLLFSAPLPYYLRLSPLSERLEQATALCRLCSCPYQYLCFPHRPYHLLGTICNGVIRHCLLLRGLNEPSEDWFLCMETRIKGSNIFLTFQSRVSRFVLPRCLARLSSAFVMHQSIPVAPIPHALSVQGGRALAYPSATPGLLTGTRGF